MSTPATDSLPIIRRAGYNPVPEEPFTGPTSILGRLHAARPLDVDAARASWGLGFAPPVPAVAVVARHDYVPPVPAYPGVESTDEGLREPRRLCVCDHPHGVHEELRRGDRCARCTCQKFVPKEPELPTTEEEERRGSRWAVVAGYLVVAIAGAFCGAGLLAAYLMVSGMLP